MTEPMEIDLRAAINAISDVIQNRPRPLREFDQIYMKAGDMVLQSEMVARWSDGKRLIFIGDGDAISVCVAYLQKREIFTYGPTEIMVLDFDERICQAITRFADKEQIETLQSTLYNCIESLPESTEFDRFYTNPPWGASNNGESVKLFVRRGMEAVRYSGDGLVVIADGNDLPWSKNVLSATQKFATDSEYFVQKMIPQLHQYHLDDNPELRSCNLVLSPLPGCEMTGKSEPVTDSSELRNFYGRENHLEVRYIRERKHLDYGKASDEEYELEYLEPK
jgi:predicted methyltransferase